MNTIRNTTSVLLAISLTACAHPTSISPRIENLERLQLSTGKSQAKIGYYVSQGALATEITTPGGGGDNVRYFPYRDIDSGLQHILASSFSDVSKLSNPFDPVEVRTKRIDYIISPEIVTTSGGSGFFTWPPTSFTFDISTNVKDSQGQTVKAIRVVGTGTAETGERLTEHGIAGRRAVEDALKKFQANLAELSNGSTKIQSIIPSSTQNPVISRPSSSVESRLKDLKELFDKGLISQDDLDSKRKQILDSM